jgi:DNA modification methylase
MRKRWEEGHQQTRNASERRIAIVYRPLAELKLDPRNLRAHSPKQVRQIARSIEAFGFNVPVLVDGQCKVIAGHGRVMACRLLGWSEVPTIFLEHLSDAQAAAFMIADNRLTENSAWNDRLLAEQLKDLAALNLDFSLELTGFEMGEIDLRIESLTPAGEVDEDPADNLSALAAGPVVTRSGDIWQLGEHRILCGSALDPAAYAVLLGDVQVHVAFIDPPFNVRIENNVSGLGSIRHRDFVMGVGEMSEAEFTTFLTRACSLHARHSVEGSLHYVCMDWRHLGELLAASRKVYRELLNLCVWEKNNGGMGSFYRSQHELVLVFKHGRRPHRNNIQLGKFGRNRSNVWHYPGANSFSRGGEEGNLLALHPTVKPVALVADAVADCTARGDIVLDGFLGSGSTLVAAARSGRRCMGLEIDPRYVDVIVRRWQAFSRDDALHAVSGRKFREIEAEVEDGGEQRKQRKARLRSRLRKAPTAYPIQERSVGKS